MVKQQSGVFAVLVGNIAFSTGALGLGTPVCAVQIVDLGGATVPYLPFVRKIAQIP